MYKKYLLFVATNCIETELNNKNTRRVKRRTGKDTARYRLIKKRHSVERTTPIRLDSAINIISRRISKIIKSCRLIALIIWPQSIYNDVKIERMRNRLENDFPHGVF